MRRQMAGVVCGCGDVLGESPVWDAQHGVLYWVDIRRSVLHKLHTTAGRLVEQSFEFGPELLVTDRRYGAIPASAYWRHQMIGA